MEAARRCQGDKVGKKKLQNKTTNADSLLLAINIETLSAFNWWYQIIKKHIHPAGGRISIFFQLKSSSVCGCGSTTRLTIRNYYWEREERNVIHQIKSKIGKNKNLLFHFILFMCARISQQQRLSYGDPFRTRFTSQSLCVCLKKGRGRRFPSISHWQSSHPLSNFLTLEYLTNSKTTESIKTLPALV